MDVATIQSRRVTPGEELGGFRIVRTIGAGSRSTVYLGHGGESRTAALKVYNTDVDPRSIDDEIAALSTIGHPHVVDLRDVGSAPSGLPFLVLERLGHGSLGQLLATRAHLAAGEAVTVLAPIVAAVGALHDSGVAHSALRCSTVLFRESGAPVLIGFGHARRFAPLLPAVQLQSSRPVLEDRVAVGRIVREVMTSVDSPATNTLMQWIASLERDGYPDDFPRLLEERIFDLATAVPVRIAHDPIPEHGRMPPRLHRAEPVPREPEPVVAGAVEILLKRFVGPSRAKVPRPTLATLRAVRRPVWVAAALGVGSLVAALILVPPNDSAESAGAPTPQPRAPSESTLVSAANIDDPVRALPVLLQARAQCVRDLSILCLEATTQSGSAALDDDVALIRSIENGETSGVLAELTEGSVLLTERHGDAALVSYQTSPDDKPASVLLVKGEAGWRIRDYIALG